MCKVRSEAVVHAAVHQLLFHCGINNEVGVEILFSQTGVIRDVG